MVKNRLLAALCAVAFLSAAGVAEAQYATSTPVAPNTKQPAFIQNQQWLDLGNGPLDIEPIEGNGSIYSSGGTGLGSTSGNSTNLTLNAIPAIQPCVGCILGGVTNLGLATTTPITITAFNGVTTVTLSAPLNITNSTLLGWGAVCPAATAANTPGPAPGTITPLQLSAPLSMRSGVGGTYPMYTQNRLCAYGALQNGFTFLYFAIGAH
jgi:hypothetical protein